MLSASVENDCQTCRMSFSPKNNRMMQILSSERFLMIYLAILTTAILLCV